MCRPADSASSAKFAGKEHVAEFCREFPSTQSPACEPELLGFSKSIDRWGQRSENVEFEVTGFLAPLVIVKRKVDGRKRSVEFQYKPKVLLQLEGASLSHERPFAED